MSESSLSFGAYLPALTLLALLGMAAWGVQWYKRRLQPSGTGTGAKLKLVSQVVLGPQQRVVVVEVSGPTGIVQLTLGVTPQHVRTLHTLPLPNKSSNGAGETSTPSYTEVAQAIKDASA